MNNGRLNYSGLNKGILLFCSLDLNELYTGELSTPVEITALKTIHRATGIDPFKSTNQASDQKGIILRGEKYSSHAHKTGT